MRVKVRTELKKGVMKEFLCEIEVFFVKKSALDVTYQHIRQERKAKTDRSKRGQQKFLGLKWNLFYLNKVIIKFWSSKNFFVPPKLGAKSPPMSECFPSYLNCYIEPYLQTGSQVQNFCVDFKLLEQVYLSRPPTFCENAPFTMPVMVLWETCTLI